MIVNTITLDEAQFQKYVETVEKSTNNETALLTIQFVAIVIKKGIGLTSVAHKYIYKILHILLIIQIEGVYKKSKKTNTNPSHSTASTHQSSYYD